MSDLIIFIIGCLVTSFTVLAVTIIGLDEGRDTERLQIKRRERQRRAERGSLFNTKSRSKGVVS